MPKDFISRTMIELRDYPTKTKLAKLAGSPDESYDSIIYRLLAERENAKRPEVNSHGYAFVGRGSKGKKAIIIGVEEYNGKQ